MGARSSSVTVPKSSTENQNENRSSIIISRRRQLNYRTVFHPRYHGREFLPTASTYTPDPVTTPKSSTEDQNENRSFRQSTRQQPKFMVHPERTQTSDSSEFVHPTSAYIYDPVTTPKSSTEDQNENRSSRQSTRQQPRFMVHPERTQTSDSSDFVHPTSAYIYDPVTTPKSSTEDQNENRSSRQSTRQQPRFMVHPERTQTSDSSDFVHPTSAYIYDPVTTPKSSTEDQNENRSSRQSTRQQPRFMVHPERTQTSDSSDFVHPTSAYIYDPVTTPKSSTEDQNENRSSRQSTRQQPRFMVHPERTQTSDSSDFVHPTSAYIRDPVTTPKSSTEDQNENRSSRQSTRQQPRFMVHPLRTQTSDSSDFVHPTSAYIRYPVLTMLFSDIKSPEFKKACSQVKNDIQRLNGVVNVCPSLTRTDEVLFLIYTSKDDIVLPQTYSRLHYVFRNVDSQSSENGRVVSSAEYLNTDLTSADANEMNVILLNNYEKLLENHSNLVSITASPIKSKKFGKNNEELIKEPCFVLFVPAKGYIPLNEMNFPEKIGEYPTDVREGTFKLYGHHAQDYHSTLRMGCAISGENKAQGTLGVFAQQNEKTYFITSAHVLLFDSTYARLKKNGIYGSQSCNQKDLVYQPDIDTFNPPHTKGPIGRVCKAIYRTGNIRHAGVEAVLVELTNNSRLPKAGTFPEGDFLNTGFSNTTPLTFTSGKVVDRTQSQFRRTEVLKYGSETGITRGLFKLSGPCVHRAIFNDGKEVVLLNQLQILGTSEGPFAEPGDSGALVLVPHEGKDNDLRALGIVTGGIGQNVCCVTPIWDILQAFESELCMKLKLTKF